jgi:hypothetical protein
VLFLRIATAERPYFIAFFTIENLRWLLSYIGVNKLILRRARMSSPVR